MSYDIWVPSYGDNSVVRLDQDGNYKGWFRECTVLSPGQLSEFMEAFNRPWGVAVDTERNYVWISNAGGLKYDWKYKGSIKIGFETAGYVTRINHSDESSIEVMRSVMLDEDSELHGIAVDSSGYVWAGDYSKNQIWKLDADGQDVGFPFPVSVYSRPEGIAIDTAGNCFVSGFDTIDNQYKVSKIYQDGSKDLIFFPVVVGENPIGIAADTSGDVWVANHGTAAGDKQYSVTKIDGSNGNIIGTFPVGRRPRGVVVMRNGHPVTGEDLILVTNSFSNNITVLDINGNPLTHFPTDSEDWKAGDEPVGISIHPDTGHIWVAGLRDYKVAKLAFNSLDDAQIISRTTVGIWKGRPGWRPGPFAIGDMTGYLFQFAGP